MTPHEKLVSLWKISKYGIKSKVYKHYSNQRIGYILKHPDYNDINIINDIIGLIKECSNNVYTDVNKMNKKIQKH